MRVHLVRTLCVGCFVFVIFFRLAVLCLWLSSCLFQTLRHHLKCQACAGVPRCVSVREGPSLFLARNNFGVKYFCQTCFVDCWFLVCACLLILCKNAKLGQSEARRAVFNNWSCLAAMCETEAAMQLAAEQLLSSYTKMQKTKSCS